MDALIKSESPSGGGRVGRFGKRRVLIVDDHELVRHGLAALVGSSLDVCGEAKDGVEAVEKVRKLNPDLVLLDLSMPIRSGTEAAQEIRAMSPSTKIVIVSMHDSPMVQQLARKLGADAFISKNSPASELAAKLRALSQNG